MTLDLSLDLPAHTVHTNRRDTMEKKPANIGAQGPPTPERPVVVSLEDRREARLNLMYDILNQDVKVQGEDVIEKWRYVFRTRDPIVRVEVFAALSEAVGDGRIPQLIADLIMAEAYAEIE